jgi:hypothetical protein
LGQAQPAAKQLNLKSLAMQMGPKFSGCPTPAEFNLLAACSINLSKRKKQWLYHVTAFQMRKKTQEDRTTRKNRKIYQAAQIAAI